MQERPTLRFQSGDAFRRRSVGTRLPRTTLDIPALPARVVADWAHEVAASLFLEPGDVEPLPLARARRRWPELGACVEAMERWLTSLGLPGVLAQGELALMACRGADYHHDAETYGGAAFCNLFLGEDQGFDVHFPGTGDRLALARGTAMLFDTAQPHAVIRRGSGGFDARDFAEPRAGTQYFLSWELPIEHAGVSRVLGVAFDADAPN